MLTELHIVVDVQMNIQTSIHKTIGWEECIVPSMRTTRMSLRMCMVVISTIILNTNVQIGSANFHSGCNKKTHNPWSPILGFCELSTHNIVQSYLPIIHSKSYLPIIRSKSYLSIIRSKELSSHYTLQRVTIPLYALRVTFPFYASQS